MKKKQFIPIFAIIGLLLVGNLGITQAAVCHDDKKDDVYSISVLNFFLTVGESIGDEEITQEQVETLIDDLVALSESNQHYPTVDIKDIEYEEDDAGDVGAFFLEFQDSIEDENLMILGFGENDGDRY